MSNTLPFSHALATDVDLAVGEEVIKDIAPSEGGNNMIKEPTEQEMGVFKQYGPKPDDFPKKEETKKVADASKSKAAMTVNLHKNKDINRQVPNTSSTDLSFALFGITFASIGAAIISYNRRGEHHGEATY